MRELIALRVVGGEELELGWRLTDAMSGVGVILTRSEGDVRRFDGSRAEVVPNECRKRLRVSEVAGVPEVNVSEIRVVSRTECTDSCRSRIVY